ncbi:MAG: amino acid permease [Candidatus Thermoplasmatota archaeon]|nr:amino acid permease [Candidatus Thermoplasmatota archaeon]
MAKLERSLSLWEVTLMSVGIILGAGIYVLIGRAAGLAGNAVWLSFVIAAIVASFTGLSYAELSSRFPDAGAEYVYVRRSFGRHPAWLVGWLIIAGSVIGGATVAMGFANYFAGLFGTAVLPVAFGALLICGVIVVAGIQETAFFTIIITLIETAGLVIIMAIGLPHLGNPADYAQMAQGIEGVLKAGVLIFFSYLGFESIARLAEETEQPQKNIPRAILLSIAITTVIYILVGIAAVSVVSPAQLAESGSPLAEIAETWLGQKSFLLLSLIALLSTFNTVLVMLLSASRLVYGIADENALPTIFSTVSARTRTPWVATVAVTAGALLFLSLGDLEMVANLTNFTIFAVFIAVNSALIYFRLNRPTREGFRVPGSLGRVPVIPVLGILASVFMIANLSPEVLLLGGGLIVVGLLVQLAMDRQKNKIF